MSKRKSEWRAVSKLFPLPVDQDILVCAGYDRQGRAIITAAHAYNYGDTKYLTGVRCGGHEWEFDFEAKDITHWMPLPAPPKI